MKSRKDISIVVSSFGCPCPAQRMILSRRFQPLIQKHLHIYAFPTGDLNGQVHIPHSFLSRASQNAKNRFISLKSTRAVPELLNNGSPCSAIPPPALIQCNEYTLNTPVENRCQQKRGSEIRPTPGTLSRQHHPTEEATSNIGNLNIV